MTRIGMQMVIDSLAMRVFELDEVIDNKTVEKRRIQARIKELEVELNPPTITPFHVIAVG